MIQNVHHNSIRVYTASHISWRLLVLFMQGYNRIMGKTKHERLIVHSMLRSSSTSNPINHVYALIAIQTMYFNLTISHRFYEIDNIKTERLRTTYNEGIKQVKKILERLKSIKPWNCN